MAREVERETVVVDGDRRERSNTGLIITVALIAVVILFFLFGGFRMFGGGSSGGSTNTNIQTPAAPAQ